MKKSKKSRVSWPSDSKLFQVKMFLKEECPAKVSYQPSTKPKAMNLPPGFEPTLYPRLNISLIPRIKWHRPPKFILKDDLRVASGGESSETLTQNLRISKVMEAFYPHRSAIPSRPSVSPTVEEERYDDSKTPNIRLIPMDDENEAAPQSLPIPAAFSGVAPDLSPAASAALSAALLKTKEPGSLVDAELLVKLLSDPKTVMNLMNGTPGKPLDTANNTLNISKPRFIQHVTSSAMDRNPSPDPFALPETRTQPVNAVSPIPSVAVQSSVSVATHPPLLKPTRPVSSAPSMNLYLQKPPPIFHTYPSSDGPKPLPRRQDSYTNSPLKPNPVDDYVVSELKTVPKPQAQHNNISTFSTGNMSRVPESTDPQIRNNGAYPMNINRDAHEVPVKNIEYYKNLIREHGVATPATNETDNYKGRDANNIKLVKVKIQKPCKYFGRGRGCKLGEKCLYLHDHSKRVRTDVAPEFPRAKRLKFGLL